MVDGGSAAGLGEWWQDNGWQVWVHSSTEHIDVNEIFEAAKVLPPAVVTGAMGLRCFNVSGCQSLF